MWCASKWMKLGKFASGPRPNNELLALSRWRGYNKAFALPASTLRKPAVMTYPITLPPGQEFHLRKFDPRRVEGEWNKASAATQVRANVEVTRDLAYRLYAENHRALLIVLQGMDTAGKDGTIRKILTGINPQSCQVVSFKQPGQEE